MVAPSLGPHLDQVLDVETATAEQPDPVAVGEMELDARVVRPGERVHSQLRADSRSAAGTSSSSGTHNMNSVLLPRKISSPPGRSSRAASGIHRYGSAQMAAPYSLMTRSTLPSRSGTCSPAARTSGKRGPASCCIAVAMRSWPMVGSTATTVAPRRTSHADTYAVPHPSSTALRPSRRSGRTPTEDSGTLKTPQDGSFGRPLAAGEGELVVAARLPERNVGREVLDRFRIVAHAACTTCQCDGSPGDSVTNPSILEGPEMGERLGDGGAPRMKPSMRFHGRDHPMQAAMPHAVVTPSSMAASTSANRVLVVGAQLVEARLETDEAVLVTGSGPRGTPSCRRTTGPGGGGVRGAPTRPGGARRDAARVRRPRGVPPDPGSSGRCPC